MHCHDSLLVALGGTRRGEGEQRARFRTFVCVEHVYMPLLAHQATAASRLCPRAEVKPEQRARHREFLRDHARFKEVVPIADPGIRTKIHQTYR